MRGGVDEGVETAELGIQRIRDIREIRRFRAREIERKDDRLGKVRRHDLVVQRLQLADDAAVHDDRGTSACARERQRLAHAAGCARDQDDTAVERCLCQLIGRRERCRRWHAAIITCEQAANSRKPWCQRLPWSVGMRAARCLLRCSSWEARL